MADSKIELDADDEIETEIIPEEKTDDEFPWAVDDDERRRSFVYVQMTDAGDASQIDGRILVENMNLICNWIKDGSIPQKAEQKIKPVSKNA